MKKFFRIMSDDINQHNFTPREKFWYGFVLVAALVAIMGIAGWLETCCNNI